MVDLRQSVNYAKYMRSEGWVVRRIAETNYFIRRLPIIGGFLKLQRPERIDFEMVDKLSRKCGVFDVIIEPNPNTPAGDLLSQGYKQAKHTYLPSKTLQIDLTQSTESIYKDLKRNIRKGIKMGEGFPVKIYSTPSEIKTFREAWKKIIKNKRHVPSLTTLLNLRKSFPTDKSLFLASHNISGRIIGGVIFTISSHDRSNYITNYMYGFTSKEGRSSLVHASLLYRGILWGKKMGCKIFDFEGIYDDRFPNKSWLGFSRFKKSFGGYEVLYPGCYTKFRLPI